MRQNFSTLLKQHGILINDGAAGSHLEGLGCNLNDKLWTAKVLKDEPHFIKQLHLDYYQAGADLGLSVSYQASIAGFMDKGLSKEEAAAIIQNSADLLLEARDEWWNTQQDKSRIYPLAVGSVGPYGAYLANGAEYRGDYPMTESVLRDFHKERLGILWHAGLDILALETIPSLEEAVILAKLVEQIGAKCWISFSCKNDTQICDGTEISECAKALEKFDCVEAIGINCTAPIYIKTLIENLRLHTTKPIMAYGNQGKSYDPTSKTWSGNESEKSYLDFAIEWHEAGASVIGGCCGVTTKEISELFQYFRK